MAMMYKFVGEALQEEGLSEKYHPQDYLNFYCLGKRDPIPKEEESSPKNSSDNTALVCVFLLFSALSLKFVAQSYFIR